MSNRYPAPRVFSSTSLRGHLAACLVSLASAVAVGCADESFTPSECEDLPSYDIREAQPSTGAVQSEGILQNSPLSAEEQRRLQQLADDGCVTLPTKNYSLK